MNYTNTYITDLINTEDVIPDLEEIYHSSILITGATGLVCSALVDFLMVLNDFNNAGINIFIGVRSLEKAKKRFGDRLDRTDVKVIIYDALDELDLTCSPEYIIHGASPASPNLYVSQPVETMLANLLGLNNILKYAANNSVKRVLFISSSEIYGKKDNRDPYDESEYGYVDILNPRACYPNAKRSCETLCVAYKEEYGVSNTIVRLGHVFGPTASRSDSRAASQFFYDVLDADNIVMKSAGLQIRSFCYVIDCISAIVTVLIKGEDAIAYNVSNIKSIASIREFAEMITYCSGTRIIYEKPSEKEARGYNLMSNSSLTSRKLEDLGWRGQFNLKTGVEHTLKIMKGE